MTKKKGELIPGGKKPPAIRPFPYPPPGHPLPVQFGFAMCHFLTKCSFSAWKTHPVVNEHQTRVFIRYELSGPQFYQQPPSLIKELPSGKAF